MRKTYALLAAIIFAIELMIIEFAVPTYAQIITSGAFFVLLFYLILGKEKLIDTITSKTKLIHRPLPKPLPKPKFKIKSKTKKSQKKPTSQKETKEEEVEEEEVKETKTEEAESEFTKQWREMERISK